jgi:WD40 repeat protein
MSDFDPYHKWLGIPPREQPAHHYRLLGITDFESDRDVISTAAERQTVFLRTLQAGEHTVLVAEMLNEISQARVTLLNADQKAEYDEGLRKQQTPEPEEEPAPEQDPLAFAAEELAAISSRPATRSRSRGGKPFWQQPWAIPAGAGGIVVLLLLMWLFSSGEEPKGSGKRVDSQSQQQIDALKQKLATAERAAKVASGNTVVSESGPLQAAARAAVDKAAAEKAIAESVVTLKGHTDTVQGIAFSPDGKRIASGSHDKTVKVWDAETGQAILTFREHEEGIRSVAFSPDGKRIASGGDDTTVKVWDATTGRVILTLKGHSSSVTSVSFSPDGTRIVSGSTDKTAKVWDATTGRVILTFKGHSSSVWSAAFSPNGKRIVSGSHDHTVKVWDAETGLGILTLKGHSGPVYPVAFSPDGTRVVSGSHDQTVKVWDAETGQALLALIGHSSYVRSVAFSPDGKRIVSDSGDRTVKVWDVETGQEMLTLKGHSSELLSVAYSPDGKRIASGGKNPALKIWNLGPAPTQPTAKSLPPSLSEGLVAYYPFNGNAQDESGNGHHGEIKNVVLTRDRHGGEEKAFYFAGRGQHISLPPFQYGSRFSVSIWANSFTDSDVQHYLSKKPGDALDSVQFYDDQRGDNHRYKAMVFSSDNLGIGRLAQHLPDTPGNWSHLVFTYDGGNTSSALRIYNHGVRADTDDFGQGRSFVSFNDLNVRSEIGSQNNGAESFHGILDDIRIYNRALSEKEVQQLYEFESGGTAVATASNKLYLTTLRPFTVESYSFTPFSGKFSPERPITVNGQSSPYGMRLHPRLTKNDAVIRYVLPSTCRFFSGAVVVENTSVNNTPTLTFHISANGNVLWKSPPMTKGDNPVGFCVPLNDSNNLVLKTTCSHSASAWSVWLDPVLLKSTGGKSLEQIANEQQARWIKKEE